MGIDFSSAQPVNFVLDEQSIMSIINLYSRATSADLVLAL